MTHLPNSKKHSFSKQNLIHNPNETIIVEKKIVNKPLPPVPFSFKKGSSKPISFGNLVSKICDSKSPSITSITSITSIPSIQSIPSIHSTPSIQNVSSAQSTNVQVTPSIQNLPRKVLPVNLSSGHLPNVNEFSNVNEFYKNYEPREVKEIVGNEKVIEEIWQWLENRKKCNGPPVGVIYGPTGCGKTTLVNILIQKFELECIEFGLTSETTEECKFGEMKEEIFQKMKICSRTRLENENRIILFDGYDQMFDAATSSNEGIFIKCLKQGIITSKFPVPILLVCNQLSTNELKFISASTLGKCFHMFCPFQKTILEKMIVPICENEQWTITKEFKEYLFEMSRFDMRLVMRELGMIWILCKHFSEYEKMIQILKEKNLPLPCLKISKRGKFFKLDYKCSTSSANINQVSYFDRLRYLIYSKKLNCTDALDMYKKIDHADSILQFNSLNRFCGLESNSIGNFAMLAEDYSLADSISRQNYAQNQDSDVIKAYAPYVHFCKYKKSQLDWSFSTTNDSSQFPIRYYNKDQQYEFEKKSTKKHLRIFEIGFGTRAVEFDLLKECLSIFMNQHGPKYIGKKFSKLNIGKEELDLIQKPSYHDKKISIENLEKIIEILHGYMKFEKTDSDDSFLFANQATEKWVDEIEKFSYEFEQGPEQNLESEKNKLENSRKNFNSNFKSKKYSNYPNYPNKTKPFQQDEFKKTKNLTKTEWNKKRKRNSDMTDEIDLVPLKKSKFI